jgi:hypothetical protein
LHTQTYFFAVVESLGIDKGFTGLSRQCFVCLNFFARMAKAFLDYAQLLAQRHECPVGFQVRSAFRSGEHRALSLQAQVSPLITSEAPLDFSGLLASSHECKPLFATL